jgi:hypothetical protein
LLYVGLLCILEDDFDITLDPTKSFPDCEEDTVEELGQEDQVWEEEKLE